MKVTKVRHAGLTVSNLDRTVAFFKDVFSMTGDFRNEINNQWIQRVTGVRSAHVKIAKLHLGMAALDFSEYLSPKGQHRAATRPNDVGNVHIGFEVEDIEVPYHRLKGMGFTFADRPQTITEAVWPNAPERFKGRTAIYFWDPDGVNLEMVQPSGRGERRSPHAGVTVSNLERTVALFKDVFGMKEKFRTEVENEWIGRVVGTPGAHLKAALLTFEPAALALEFLEYVSPRGQPKGRTRPNDVGNIYLAFEVEDIQEAYQELKERGFVFADRPQTITEEKFKGWTAIFAWDPDGINLELLQPPRGESVLAEDA